MSKIDRLTAFLKKFFGFSSEREQQDATRTALEWAFVIGLLAGISFIPFPFNAFVMVVVIFWFVGWQRHNFKTVNKYWNRLFRQ